MVQHSLQPLRLIRNVQDRIPARLLVAIMMFNACLVCYMLRVNMSINILAMVAPLATGNGTNTSALSSTPVPDYGTRFNWTASDQSLLLGSYFWGYLVTSLPGGIMAEWLGGRTVIGYSLLVSAILTGLSPLAASIGFWFIYGARFATGVLAGCLYPALHNLISLWSPPDEKGKFVSAMMGGTFGTVITWPLAGILVESYGWTYAFYVPAVIAAIIAIVWFLIVADAPATHPRITAAERDYIQKSLGETIARKKSFPPFLRVITSVPFWSLLILHYGNLWGLYFLLTAAPKFMNEVLGFNLAQAGFLSALPYLARMTAGFIFGSIGDYIRRNDLLPVTVIRKSFCLFSHIIPGLFLIAICFAGDNPYVCVAIITLSLGFNGASTMTNLQNSQDLAPNYAGTLYGIVNFVGTTAGFITPLLVAYFTKENNTLEEWKSIFQIGAVAYIVPAILFVFFGSGETQSWNCPKELEATKKPENVTTVEATP